MEKVSPEPAAIIFHPLKQDNAQQILSWRYAPPYDYYNFDTASFQEELRELIGPQNAYYAMLNADGELESFCCFGPDAQVLGGGYGDEALDIGMGLRPDLTGQGRGVEYAQKVIEFGEAQYRMQDFRVTIAAFNQQAQRVWSKLGFKQVGEFAKTDSEEQFVIMIHFVDGQQLTIPLPSHSQLPDAQSD